MYSSHLWQASKLGLIYHPLLGQRHNGLCSHMGAWLHRLSTQWISANELLESVITHQHAVCNTIARTWWSFHTQHKQFAKNYLSLPKQPLTWVAHCYKCASRPSRNAKAFRMWAAAAAVSRQQVVAGCSPVRGSKLWDRSNLTLYGRLTSRRVKITWPI